MPGCLKVWRLCSVEIHPHLSWSECLSPEQLREKAHEVQTNLNDLNVRVWDQSTYTYETNGSWNVTLSVSDVVPADSGNKNSLESKIEYIYMIRRDSKFNKTFGCPYYNSEYSYTHRPLLEYYNSDLFKRFESALIEVIGEAEHIDHFETFIPQN
jgi:hypothetical protein